MQKDTARFLEMGMGFGITSGVITTLGMIVGMDAITHSLRAVLGGIVLIAIADALSDSLGIHISSESQSHATHRQIWTATAATFFSKLILASSFIFPFLFWSIQTAIYISIAWGIFVLVAYNIRLSRLTNEKPIKVISEHLLIAAVVVLISSNLGSLIERLI